MKTKTKTKPHQQVVGQDSLIKEINKIFSIFKQSECNLKPHFFLAGPSGSGKTHTIKSMVAKHDIGFMTINAAQLTKEGTSGNSLSKALSPLIDFAGKPVVILVDEFDKLFISGNSNSMKAHEWTTGVQNEFLKVLEGDVTSVYGDFGKYVEIGIDNVLFVFAGAFNGEENLTLDRIREFGIKTEFIGRVGLIYNTSNLTLEDMYEILENSEVLEKYLDLFVGVERDDVVSTIKEYLEKIYPNNTLGARIINTLINQYFIKGGKFDEEEVKKISFQNKLELD